MKSIVKYMFLMGLLFVISCKDEDIKGSGGTITANDFVYNKAIDYASLDEGGVVNIKSAGGVRLVYVYLVRNLATDSVIFRGFAQEGEARDYTFTVPYKIFPVKSLASVKGIKIMSKLNDNTTLEGFVNVSVYDPAKPLLTNFAEHVSPDISGSTSTSITGNISSEAGLKQVNLYDNYKGEWALLHSVSSLNEAKQHSLNYAYTYRKAASQIKIDAEDIYGQKNSTLIDLDVDLSLFLPVLTGFPTMVEPDVEGGPTPVAGTITSITGLKQVNIYDDYQGTYVLVESITGLDGATSYDFNYDYIYRKKAKNLKVEAVDNDDASAHAVVELYIHKEYHLYENLTMMAQGTTSEASTTSFFVGQDGTLIGNCDVSGNENIVDFLTYYASSGFALYSPSNATNVATNFRCEGVSWVFPGTNDVKHTRFRVLVQGSSTAQDDIYTQFNDDTIGALDDEFFDGIAVPSSSAPRYDPSVTPSASIFNLTTAYLIWVRIPDQPGPLADVTSFTNALIYVKQVNIASPTAQSTIKMDILMQKK